MSDHSPDYEIVSEKDDEREKLAKSFGGLREAFSLRTIGAVGLVPIIIPRKDSGRTDLIFRIKAVEDDGKPILDLNMSGESFGSFLIGLVDAIATSVQDIELSLKQAKLTSRILFFYLSIMRCHDELGKCIKSEMFEKALNESKENYKDLYEFVFSPSESAEVGD